MLRDDGSIHYPFSHYLTNQFNNPHTREQVAQSLRILYRFCNSHDIDLSIRAAAESRSLSYSETKQLADLCWRPLSEIETMADSKVRLLSSSKSDKPPRELPRAVSANTSKKRQELIAIYLKHFCEVFLEPNILRSEKKRELKDEYEKVENQLKHAVQGTKQNHHFAINSLPTDKYLSIIEAIYVRPHELFLTKSGQPSRNLYRDRAIALLAAEGLRAGTIGNIVFADFQSASEKMAIKDNRSKRSVRVTTGVPLLKLGDSTSVNGASETLITLWPFTVQAVNEYIQHERTAVLSKQMKNRSEGFLFLSGEGKPIKHRASITELFHKLKLRLTKLGLLDVGDDPYFTKRKRYEFTAHVLRHSAASFFLQQKCIEYSEMAGVARPREFVDVPDRVKDMMKIRFGWTVNSKMPELYAARALSDNANVNMMEFNQKLLDEVAALKQKEGEQR